MEHSHEEGEGAENCVSCFFQLQNDLQTEYPRSNNGLALVFPLLDVYVLEAAKQESAAFSGDSEGTETCVRVLQSMCIPDQGHCGTLALQMYCNGGEIALSSLCVTMTYHQLMFQELCK